MKKLYLVMAAIFALTVTGCNSVATQNPQSDSNQGKVESTSPSEVINPSEQPGKTVDSTSPSSSNAEDPAANSGNQQTVEDKQYYVNPDNFRVYPVDPADKDEKIVLLTFDDGPKGEHTLEILDILDKYQAKSLWFISGFNYGWNYQPNPQKAEQFKKLVLEIKNRGHVIGNHSWEHENLRKLTPDTVRREIVELNNVLENITGERPKFFRPPHGAGSDVSRQVVSQEGMQSINWSVGSLDWELKTPEAVVKQTLDTVHNGANILFHDKELTAKALDQILSELQKQGYKFVVPTEVK